MKNYLFVLVIAAFLTMGCVNNGEQTNPSLGKGYIAVYNFSSRVDLNMNGTFVPSASSVHPMTVRHSGDRTKVSIGIMGSNTSLLDSYITPDGNFTCRNFPIQQCVKDEITARPPTEMGVYMKELKDKGFLTVLATNTRKVNGFDCKEEIYTVNDVPAYLNYINFNKSQAIPIDVKIDEVKMTYCEKDGLTVSYSSALNAVVNKTSARSYLLSTGTNESANPIPDSIVSNVSYTLISLDKDVEIANMELTPP
ncbi:MAG: hypothetical protein J7L23_00655 [Candidatus Diapherotrites archaeon]|nr:hypothetical protein [Candidatus Diapherotrites archaeon]